MRVAATTATATARTRSTQLDEKLLCRLLPTAVAHPETSISKAIALGMLGVRVSGRDLALASPTYRLEADDMHANDCPGGRRSNSI